MDEKNQRYIQTAVKMLIFISCLFGAASASDAVKFKDRMRLDFGGSMHLPVNYPTGIGGLVGYGIDMRDFVVSLNGKVYLTGLGEAESGLLYVGLIRVEPKIPIIPNWVTLLPSIGGGVGSTSMRVNGSADKKSLTGYWIEIGVGAQVPITQEVSLLPRLQYNLVQLGTAPDTVNLSAINFDFSIRYSFGQSVALPY
jgi:hypothetical protein